MSNYFCAQSIVGSADIKESFYGGKIYILTIARVALKYVSKFIGVFECFYNDSIYKDVSTRFVTLVYECQVGEVPDLRLVPELCG